MADKGILTIGDLTEGKRVDVTVTRGEGKAVSILVRAPKKKREGGEGERDARAVTPPRRREGEREGDREGEEKKERRREGEREGDREEGEKEERRGEGDREGDG